MTWNKFKSVFIISFTYLIAASLGEVIKSDSNVKLDRTFSDELNELKYKANEEDEPFVFIGNTRNSNKWKKKEMYEETESEITKIIADEDSGNNYSNAEPCASDGEGTEECKIYEKECKPVNNSSGYICSKCIKDDYTENDENKCVAHCSDGTESKKHCDNIKMKCKQTSESTCYECKDCIDGFVTNGSHCIAHCSDGTASKRHCDNLKMKCKQTSESTYYECKDCIDGFVANGSHCVDPCALDGKGTKECKKYGKECKREKNSNGYVCGKCIKNDFTENDKNICVAHCSDGTASKRHCDNLKMKCKQTSESTYYECKDCIDGFVANGSHCVDPCALDGKGTKECKKYGKECKREKNSNGYVCGKCIKNDFTENDKNICVAHCSDGTASKRHCDNLKMKCKQTSESTYYECKDCIDGFVANGSHCVDPCALDGKGTKECKKYGKECKREKNSNGYVCGKCIKNDFTENDKNICVAHCSDGTASKRHCDNLKMKCKQTSESTYYECKDCIDGFVANGSHCVDPCALDGKGTKECKKYGKECKREKNSNGYVCGKCIKNDFTENDKNICVAHCSDGTASKKHCDNLKMNCKKTRKGQYYECKGCIDSFTTNGSHCVAHCSPGTKHFNVCEKEHRKCERLEKYPYSKCIDCKDGYEALKPLTWLGSEQCVEHCSSRTTSAAHCKRLKRNCHVTKQKPFYECRCKDKLTEKNGNCVEYCVSRTESEKTCTKQNKVCNKLPTKPFFECGKCIEKYEEKDKQCVGFCSEGTKSKKYCSAQNKMCKTLTKNPFFECSVCKPEYEKVGDNCLEYCANGTASEKSCIAQNKVCKNKSSKPFFTCAECLEGYILENDKCIKYCENESNGQNTCAASNMKCHITKVEPFYECVDCLDGFTEKWKECVEYCIEDTASERNCSAANRKCHKESVSPFFKCGSCKNGFVELNNTCIAHCTDGTESEKNCTAQRRICEMKKEAPFFSCGKCKREFGEKDNKCLDHCTQGLRGFNTCSRQNKICKIIKTGLYYNCTECIAGYISKGSDCVNPCNKDEDGRNNCSALGRECIFNPGEEYRCGKCNNSDWIEDGIRCIDPCGRMFPDEENTTWSEMCESANATCKYNHVHNTINCICHENDTVFNWKNRVCYKPCEYPFPNEENATWSEICENASANCEHDLLLNKTSCRCHEKNNVFNMSSKSCLNLCSKEIDGIIWSNLCSKINADCVLNESERGVTCKCKQPEEIFDDLSKTCKSPCDLGFFDDDTKTWSEICEIANAKCLYDFHNVTCECLEEHTVFNATTKSCVKLHPCDLPMNVYPCKNNGTCEKTGTDYKCKCNDEWYGEHCEHKNFCIDETVCHAAKCMNTKHHSYLCTCEDDQYYDYEKKVCEKIVCLDKTCPPFKECHNGSCVCKAGFEEVNEECQMTDKECEDRCERKNVNCVNFSSSTEVTCVCKPGYYLNPSSHNCEASRCIFPFHPCEQICTFDDSVELCGCFDGFRLTDNHTCEVEKEKSCDADLYISNRTECKNGKCIKKNQKEECVCNQGFTKSADGQCVDICEIEGHEMIQSLCPNGCIHENGKIRCICTGKYTQASDGVSCIERDYCQKEDIGNIECGKIGKMCKKHNKEPWYHCVCPKDEENCIDPCSEEKNQECALTYQTCKYINGNETCQCPYSMIFDRKSNRCQFANHFYYITIDVKGGHSDINVIHAMFDERNVRKSISNSMKLLYGPSLLNTDVIECRNKEGIQTCTFSMTFEENAEGIIKRLKAEQLCKTSLNSVEYCTFLPDLTVTRKSIETAKFSSNRCGQQIKNKFCPDDSNICNPLSSGYTCLCKRGFSPVSTFFMGNDERFKYDTCQDIDECIDNPCWKNSMCKNTYGSFLCNCKKGYVENSTKNGCQGVCDDNPCGNNGKCKSFGDHEYKCECYKGYSGANCMEADVYLKKYNLNASIIGAVLGIVLLLSILFIIVLMLRIHKNLHDSFDLQMDNNKNKFELLPWLQVKDEYQAAK